MTGHSRWSDGTLRPATPEPSPFERRAVPEVPFAARILRRERADIAAIAIENLLAEARPAELSVRHVTRLSERYRLSATSAANVRIALYAKAYHAFVADNRVSDVEASYLDEL